MTSPIEPPQTDAGPRTGLLETLAKNHKEIGYGLFGLAALFAVLPIALVVQYGWPKAMSPVFTWGVLITFAALAAALIGSFRAPDAKLSEVDKLRLVLIFLGGTVGLLTALLGLALPFFQYSAVFAGGATEWRKNPVALWTTALAFIGGLGLTFASLQVGRGQERENALMRRLLYGFNAVFSTLLLAAILLLVNVLPYLPQIGAHDFIHKFLGGTFDWTQSRIYSLSERTKNTLTNLKEPVKVYVLLDSADALTEQVETLLENCRAVNPKLTWDHISSLSASRLEQIPQKLREKITDPRGGLLVVYGDEAQGQAQFVRRDKLFTVQPDEAGAGAGKLLFQGEGALLQAIRSVTENAEKKPVVYFVQGDGELDYNDGREDSTEGMGVIARTMRQNEVYDLKDLKFTGDLTEVPADADAVVVVRPQKMKPAALKALYAYMGYDYDEAARTARDLAADKTHRAGKLLVLMDVQVQDKQMLQTGLDPLLAKFGVQPGDARVLTLQDPRVPTEIDAATSRTSRNPVAKAFAAPNREIFHFDNVRAMKRSAAPGAGPFTADELVVTDSAPVWEEPDLVTPPPALAKAHFKGPFSDDPISLAVAVAEAKNDMPNDPVHAGVGGEGKPRLVAFGAAGWVSNDGLLGGPDGAAKYALFTSCLSWLRERPDIGATPVEADETKARIPFHPNITADTAMTIQLLPLAQMILAITAGGIGVWLVRRR